MAFDIVTAKKGVAHVTASQAADMQAGVFGAGRYTLATGNRLACSMSDSNTLTVDTGSLIADGRHIVNEAAATFSIANGAQASYRHDLAVLNVSVDPSTGVTTIEQAVLQGTPASTEDAAEDPEYAAGNLLDGDLAATIPVARVKLAGLTPTCEGLLSNVYSLADIAAAVADPVGGSITGSPHTGFYCSAYETIAGVALGFNVNPAQNLAVGDRICVLTTGKAFSDRGSRLLRGVFPNKQAGMFATYADDGHTIALTAEQSVGFAIGDTGSAFIPCAWVL